MRARFHSEKISEAAVSAVLMIGSLERVTGQAETGTLVTFSTMVLTMGAQTVALALLADLKRDVYSLAYKRLYFKIESEKE